MLLGGGSRRGVRGGVAYESGLVGRVRAIESQNGCDCNIVGTIMGIAFVGVIYDTVLVLFLKYNKIFLNSNRAANY